MPVLPNPLIVAGPTASGKSLVAAHLARLLGGAVVNGDPYQIYSNMAVITAQPDQHEQTLAPHHLYGVLDPSCERDAASFAATIRAVIATLENNHQAAVVVSGSGLYLRAIGGWLDTGLPASVPALRAELETLPLDDLLAELKQRDPDEFTRIDKQNPRRVIRAVEICRLSGRAVSALRQQRSRTKPLLPVGVYLDLPADSLKARISARANSMLSGKLKEEMQDLAARPLGRMASQTLGLDLARSWCRGDISHEDALEQLTTRTWQYARRQRTWFRRASELLPLAIGDSDSPEEIAVMIVTCLDKAHQNL